MHKAEMHVRADQSARTQASRQIWREPACRRPSTVSAARCVIKTNEEIEINLPDKKKQAQQAAGDARSFAFIYFQSSDDTTLTLLSLSYISV